MAIGLGLWRAAGRGRARRSGRQATDRGAARTTVREVCLIGLDRRVSTGEWAAGQEVAWLGRTYRIVAAGLFSESSSCPGSVEAGSGRATARRYVHLSHCGRH
jgi:hypothetical protein